MTSAKRMTGSFLLLSVSMAEGAQLPALQEEIQWLQAEQYVTVATKTRERVDKSGSTVTVITRQQLQQMGPQCGSVLVSRRRPSGRRRSGVGLGLGSL